VGGCVGCVCVCELSGKALGSLSQLSTERREIPIILYTLAIFVMSRQVLW
jgi:hypothetical protein